MEASLLLEMGHLFFIMFVNGQILFFFNLKKMYFVRSQKYRLFSKIVRFYLRNNSFFFHLSEQSKSFVHFFSEQHYCSRIEFRVCSQKCCLFRKNDVHLYLLQPFSSILSHLTLPSPHIVDNLEKSIE